MRPSADLRAIGKRPDSRTVERAYVTPVDPTFRRSTGPVEVQAPAWSAAPMQHPAGMGPSDGYRPAIAVPVGAPQVLPLPPVALPGRQRRIWPDHHVQWGVAREAWRFDIEDPAAHRGRTQHAYPLGRDELAVCGFETPLVRAFIGPKQPLLALAGPDNPRCRSCASVVVAAPPMVPHVSPYAPERRFDGRTWIDDRLRALGIQPAPRPDLARTRPLIDPPWPATDRPLPQLGPGPQAASKATTTDATAADAARADDMPLETPILLGP